MRGRGLKQDYWNEGLHDEMSPPMRGRGLKQITDIDMPFGSMSPPMRGRGLKRLKPALLKTMRSRPPCGGVD